MACAVVVSTCVVVSSCCDSVGCDVVVAIVSAVIVGLRVCVR